jgi:hypothetical protein
MRVEPPAPRDAAPLRAEPPAPRDAAPPRVEPPVPRDAAPPRAEPPVRRDSAQPPRDDAIAPPAPLPDAAAMVERLRRMREQRERAAGATEAGRPSDAPAHPDTPAEPRFHPGDLIHATPYGEGEVVRCRVTADQEILVVAFPDHGELTIDAAVSAVRLIERRADAEETEDPPF